MYILVTGGCGFIGSHLCKLLIETGNNVICLDNLYTGDISNISCLLEHPNFSFIEHNIENCIDIKADLIYHLACPASPKYYQKTPIDTLKTNFLGTMNVLELAKKYNSKVLLASTSEIYGDPLEHPQKETYNGNVNPNGIRSCYDEGKRISETLCCEYNRQYGVNIQIARIFNTYGPYMNIEDGRVFCNFLVQALKNEDITIYGNGSQTRSLCYIDDLVDGLVKLMNLNKFYGPINLGNEDENTIYNIANIIKDKVNSKSKIIYKSLPEDDPKKRCPDIGLAKSKLSWEPKIKLDDGISKSLSWFRNKIK